MINWKVKTKDRVIITKIAQRAALELKVNFMDIQMDITAVHLNDVELRLQDFLDSDKFNFTHDIRGIQNKIDRNTGKLTNCFLPRFSK